MLASFVGTLLAPPGGNAKCLGRDCLSSTEIRKNSSELRNLSSEVSFHSSEVLYPGSVENFRFLGSYWEIPPWGMRLVGKASQKKSTPTYCAVRVLMRYVAGWLSSLNLYSANLTSSPV